MEPEDVMRAIVRVHAAAGATGMLLIAGFMSATVASEVFADAGGIVTVKRAILWMIPLLVAALALTGATGFRLGRDRRSATVEAKRRRMPFIAGNGLVVLVPAAIFLAMRAEAGAFDAVFFLVQVIEIVAGAINMTLLARNFRDGRRLAGRGRK